MGVTGKAKKLFADDIDYLRELFSSEDFSSFMESDSGKNLFSFSIEEPIKKKSGKVNLVNSGLSYDQFLDYLSSNPTHLTDAPSWALESKYSDLPNYTKLLGLGPTNTAKGSPSARSSFEQILGTFYGMLDPESYLKPKQMNTNANTLMNSLISGDLTPEMIYNTIRENPDMFQQSVGKAFNEKVSRLAPNEDFLDSFLSPLGIASLALGGAGFLTGIPALSVAGKVAGGINTVSSGQDKPGGPGAGFLDALGQEPQTNVPNPIVGSIGRRGINRGANISNVINSTPTKPRHNPLQQTALDPRSRALRGLGFL